MDLEVVTLRPRSRAEYAALTALVDLGELLAASEISIEDTRVIGGHMVAIHVARHGLDQSHVRMTVDTDCGLDIVTLRRLDVCEHFATKNYHLREGHRFVRVLDGPGSEQDEAVIDVLIPNYRSGWGSPRTVGKLRTYQTPGRLPASPNFFANHRYDSPCGSRLGGTLRFGTQTARYPARPCW